MHLVLLCATRRGYLLLEKLAELAPQLELTVFSFREEAWEPPFLHDIRSLTLEKNGRFLEARNVGSARHTQFWQDTPVDLLLAVSWRYLVPPSIFKRPRLGAYVFHDSMLPHYRGFSPTVWSIVNGEDHTGVTLLEMADGVDEGDIVDQERVPIGADETVQCVMDRVTDCYLKLLERNLHALMNGSAKRIPQDHTLATYTCKRLPEDSRIHWSHSTAEIFNLIRGCTAPYPGAFTYLGDERIRIWEAKRMSRKRSYVGRIPGRIVEVWPNEGSVVMTGDGELLVTKVQLDEKTIVCASEVLNSLSHTLR